MTISANFPALKPSLLLDFANVERLDPRITFTRASNATYFDANGVLQTAASGVARFDHNPTTLQSLGLLIEEQRTNLLTYSAEFDNAAWGKSDTTVTANAVVALDGTLTGDLIIPSSTSATDHAITQATSIASGVPVVVSVFAKAAGYNFLFIRGFGLGGSGGARFNLSTGTVTGVTNYTSASITAVGNGWYRCVAIGTTAISSGGVFFNVSDTDTFQAWSGNGSSGIALWGAQVESGTGITFPTSYIPTVAATVTRNADVASMTGTNFSSWYNATEGTVYFESQTTQGANAYPYSLFGADTFNRISSNYATIARITSSIRISSTFEAAETTPNNSAPAGVFGKGSVAYKVNDFGFSWNGAAALTDTSTTLPTVLKLDIGNNGALSGNFLNGHIRRIAYYPVRLSNDQLQALTR
jgi:hypothetical protein